jgi:UDP-N-acetylmuramoylalanine--D-glutamate ligase
MPPTRSEAVGFRERAVPAAGARALVVGMGRSGLALARFLAARGVRVRMADLRSPAQLGDALAGLPPGTETVLGGYDGAALDGCAAVYASPGVPWDIDLLQTARSSGLTVSSEMDLFFRLCPASIVGITGTNGKTTTTALLGSVLAQGPRPVLVGGNIGDTVLDRLEELTPEHWVVLELSSFQLESCERPRARIGVVLNVTPDHLDRHTTMEAYVAAKARLLRSQEPGDDAVLNGLDPACREMAELTRARVTWFDRHQPVPPMQLPGRHNRLNALAAAAAGRAAGLSDEAIEAGVRSFQGVEHRLELVGEWGGVRWYDDSKATNPDAGLVGLRAFEGVPVVLIAGGYGGGFELGEWLAAARSGTRAAVLIGASASELAEGLTGHPVHQAATLEEAVERAHAVAQPGDVVLLSPAYKSFDMFANYEERGRRFKAAVRRIHGTG